LVTYISPAKELLAAATVDIVHCMQPSHEIAILVGTKAHIDPGCDIDPGSTCKQEFAMDSCSNLQRTIIYDT